MSLRLEPGSPKGYRPKTGQIFLMRTTAGLIPVGVTSTEAFFGACVMIHPYRALVHDITDTSYYSLIEKNELLISPVMVPKPDFSKGGYFTKNSDKNAPAPIPFDKYYFYVDATSWNPHELGFSPTTGAFPYDRLPDFDPIEYALDQDMGERVSVFAPFFGLPAASVDILPQLHQRTGAQLVPVFMWREADGHYSVRLAAPIAVAGRDSVAIMSEFNALLEAEIRAHPGQYFWVHRRFKTLPEGGRRHYPEKD